MENLLEPICKVMYAFEELPSLQESLKEWEEKARKYNPIIIQGKFYTFDELFEKDYEDVRIQRIKELTKYIEEKHFWIAENITLLN